MTLKCRRTAGDYTFKTAVMACFGRKKTWKGKKKKAKKKKCFQLNFFFFFFSFVRWKLQSPR